MPEHTNLLQTAQQFKRAYAAALRPVEQAHDLTRNEVDVLLFLANHPAHDTARDIAELRGLSKSHICKSVDSLTRRGFLAARQDGRDRRVMHLQILPAAQSAVTAAQQAQQGFFQALFQGVSPEEHAAVDRILKQMISNLREEPNPC